jgi:hypothetical protein
MCTAADANAGATPAANNTVVEDTPYAIPNDPSTNWATTPARASNKKFFIYYILLIITLPIVFVYFDEPDELYDVGGMVSSTRREFFLVLRHAIERIRVF